MAVEGRRASGRTRQSKRTRHQDNVGLIPVLAKAVREVESGVQRGRSERTGFQVVALLVRDTYTALSAVALYGGPALTFSDATLPVIGAPVFTQVWSHVLPFSAYVKLQMEQMFMGSPASASLPWLALMSAVALAMFLLAGLLLRRAMQHPLQSSPA